MPFTFNPEPLPLTCDAEGQIRIVGTRLLLDDIVCMSKDGAPPEYIARSFELPIADVYAILTYYHRHRDDVEKYLVQQEQDALAIRQQIEAQQMGNPEMRERILATRARMEQARAQLGH